MAKKTNGREQLRVHNEELMRDLANHRNVLDGVRGRVRELETEVAETNAMREYEAYIRNEERKWESELVGLLGECLQYTESNQELHEKVTRVLRALDA